jgi:hypothetical protein
MKLLLDENLPHEFRHLLAPHDAFTVAFMGWAGIHNGVLLAKAAEEGFDAVISLDSGIEFEQNLAALPCSVVILDAQSNRLRHLQPLVTRLRAALASLQPRSIVHVGP